VKRVLLGLTLLMILCSGACYGLVAEVDTAACDRDAGQCTVTLAKVGRTTTQSFPVAELTGAALRPLPGPEPNDNTQNMTVRVVLLKNGQPVPFMTYASAFGLSGMEADVNAVTRYVASPSVKRLDLRRDNRMFAALAALPPLAIGVVLLFLALRRPARHGR
jgi:hypothetical protein